jgi:hypothetical protein
VTAGAGRKRTRVPSAGPTTGSTRCCTAVGGGGLFPFPAGRCQTTLLLPAEQRAGLGGLGQPGYRVIAPGPGRCPGAGVSVYAA